MSDLSTINEKQDLILEALSEQKETQRAQGIQIDTLHKRVVGDDEMKNPGLIDQVNSHKKKIKEHTEEFEKISKRRAKERGFKAALAAVGGVIGSFIAWLINVWASSGE